ncbi:MAG: hypothetical protein JWO30_433 [Fibrobacteres bacterium]|nr:hypothetical protein [Fibrobacterota bacterium]
MADQDKPMMNAGAAAHPRLQTLIIVAAILGTELVLGMLAWNTYHAFEKLKSTTNRISQSEKAKDDLLLYQEILSSSMHLAVSTGNQYWTDRYCEYETKLDSALQGSISLPAPDGVSPELQYRGEYSEFNRLSHQAIEMIASDERETAQYLVFGRKYMAAQDSLHRKIAEIIRVLDEGTGLMMKDQKRSTLVSVLIIVGMASGLFIAWLIILQLLRKWQLDLFRANRQLLEKSGELEALNRSLESKVAERTADLSRKHAELQEMNQKLTENQNQLLQSEKMASIGQLAAGVAHEINNPMSFILSNLSCLMRYLGPIQETLLPLYALAEADAEARAERGTGKTAEFESISKVWEREDIPFILEDIEKITSESLEGGNRIKDIVANLKTFARLDEAEMKRVDVNESIESTLKISGLESVPGCTVHKRLGHLPFLLCCPGQLNHALLNLITNAAQAISGQGEITVESRIEEGKIRVAITDTGVGIPEENLPKLFTPFFTTRPVGKGVGLGLSLCHGIIKKHNGRIEVQSQPGKGSTFTIFLPLGSTAPTS